MKKILGYMRKASEQYNMLAPEDHVCVGISGGKDSLLLAHGLNLYRKYLKMDYKLSAVTVDLGLPGFDGQGLHDYVEQELGIPHTWVKTDIGELIFNVRKEKNPCSLCARMRKGALYTAAKELGCNKAAFGHHADDLIETLLMSMMYEGKLNVFSPVTHLSRQDITLIRPLILLPERDIVGAVNRLKIKAFKNPCPASGNTKREETKNLIHTLTKSNPAVKKSLLAAICNTDQYNLWDKASTEE